MHKVSRMTQTPTTCLHCGRGNTPDDPDTMDEFFAIDLERDVNWGDSTYICMYCARVISELSGHVDMASLTEVMNTNERLKKKLHDTRALLEAKNRRLEQITAGARALKSEKKRQAKKKAA